MNMLSFLVIYLFEKQVTRDKGETEKDLRSSVSLFKMAATARSGLG